MPTYDFTCDSCSHKFEKTLMISERDQPISEPCPKCQKEGEVRRDWSFTTPGLASDTTLTADKKTGGQWGELMGRMKKNIPERYQGRLDRTTSHTGNRWKG